MDVTCQTLLSFILTKGPQNWSQSPGCHGYHCSYIIRVKCRGYISSIGYEVKLHNYANSNFIALNFSKFKTKSQKVL